MKKMLQYLLYVLQYPKTNIFIYLLNNFDFNEFDNFVFIKINFITILFLSQY